MSSEITSSEIMNEVDVKFESEGLTGVVPVGTYLSDAASRLGIRFEPACDLEEKEHSCSVTITTGLDLLSDLTSQEIDTIEAARENGERLACQTRIEKAGEVVVMTKAKDSENEVPKPAEVSPEEYRKQFAELPLEKKIGEIVHLEMMTLSETLTYVANAPYTVADKILEVMAVFGFRKEEKAKVETRPKEHRVNEPKVETNGASAGAEPAEVVDQEELDKPIDATPIVDEETGKAV